MNSRIVIAVVATAVAVSGLFFAYSMPVFSQGAQPRYIPIGVTGPASTSAWYIDTSTNKVVMCRPIVTGKPPIGNPGAPVPANAVACFTGAVPN